MFEVHGADGATFSQFAGMTKEAVSAGLTKDVLNRAAEGESAKLDTWMRAVKMEGVSSLVGDRLVSVLHDDVGSIFANVWNDCSALRAAAKDTMNTDEASTVVLTEHEFSYEVEPEVDVYIGGVNLGGFKFVAKMSCTVSALALEIQRGAVTGACAGSCVGGAEITLAGTSVWKREFLHKDLPGELKLKAPIRLV